MSFNIYAAKKLTYGHLSLLYSQAIARISDRTASQQTTCI